MKVTLDKIYPFLQTEAKEVFIEQIGTGLYRVRDEKTSFKQLIKQSEYEQILGVEPKITKVEVKDEEVNVEVEEANISETGIDAEDVPVDEMTVKELREFAEELNLNPRQRKSELIKEIKTKLGK